MTAPSLTATELKSDWKGLSPHLLAHFFEVDNDNGVWKRTDKTDPATVVAPLTEASMKSHSATAQAHRMKSMRMRKSAGM